MTDTNTIHRRPLGKTGIQVSELAFGCGPVSDLMTGSDFPAQDEVLRHAVSQGINWIDTAATYGRGSSERAVGAALRRINAQNLVHIATKVRLDPAELEDIPGAVRRSLEASLARLGVDRVTLIQLHNAVTERRGDEATSVTPADVLRRGGIRHSLAALREEGLARHIGITAIGAAASLRDVVRDGAFETIQVPYSLLNPSAGTNAVPGFSEADYGQVIDDARRLEMGVFAIRIFAAGALLGQPPSPYTRVSRFFPLDLYRRDEQRARRLREILVPDIDMADLAIRFALQYPGVSSAIIGFGRKWQVDAAIRSAGRGALPEELRMQIETFEYLR